MQEKNVLKGVSKALVRKEITHPNCIDVLKTNETLVKAITPISYNHQLYNIVQNKVALTRYYEKMNLLTSIESVPFGYSPKQV